MSESFLSTQVLESLVSISADEDSFYVLASTIQSLYNSLKENASTRGKDRYFRLMAYILESYLNKPKLSFLRQHLAKTIARQTQNDYAAHYLKQRFAKAEIYELLKQHHNLTGKWLILTHVDYNRQKFKVKQA